MADEKKDKQKRVDRFVYDAEDMKHIFRLGDIGGVFTKKEENTTVSLKKLLQNSKK